MKYAEIKSVLIRKKFPPHTIQTEIQRIQALAEEIAKDANVPVDIITKMISENIKYYVGSNSGT